MADDDGAVRVTTELLDTLVARADRAAALAELAGRVVDLLSDPLLVVAPAYVTAFTDLLAHARR